MTVARAQRAIRKRDFCKILKGDFMRRVPVTLVFVLFLLLIFGCAPANLPRIEPSTQQPNAAEQKKIAAGNGHFILKNLRLVQYLGSARLDGEVENDTGKQWKTAEFVVRCYDKADNEIKSRHTPPFNRTKETFVIHDLGVGEIKTIGSGFGATLIGVNYSEISRYDIDLKSGINPANYLFIMTKPVENEDLVFQDENLIIKFSISKRQIGFALKNKTNPAIKINWDQVSYIDVLGKSHKTMHSGIKYIDRNNPQSPTVIPPNSKIEDVIIPTDYVEYISGKYGGWEKLPFFPDGSDAKLYKGESIGIYMPLELNKNTKDYSFSFKIQDVEI